MLSVKYVNCYKKHELYLFFVHKINVRLNKGRMSLSTARLQGHPTISVIIF